MLLESILVNFSIRQKEEIVPYHSGLFILAFKKSAAYNVRSFSHTKRTFCPDKD